MKPRSGPQRRLALGYGVAALAVLTGCATAPRPALETAEGPRSFWSGRLALNVETDPPQRWSAGFELSGDAQTGQLRLLSPFGQTMATAHWTPQQARLQQGNDTRLYPDMDSLTTELTGTALPIGTLLDWLQGLSTVLDGWEVDLSEQPSGRMRARRLHPLPVTSLTLLFD